MKEFGIIFIGILLLFIIFSILGKFNEPRKSNRSEPKVDRRIERIPVSKRSSDGEQEKASDQPEEPSDPNPIEDSSQPNPLTDLNRPPPLPAPSLSIVSVSYLGKIPSSFARVDRGVVPLEKLKQESISGTQGVDVLIESSIELVSCWIGGELAEKVPGGRTSAKYRYRKILPFNGPIEVKTFDYNGNIEIKRILQVQDEWRWEE